MTRLLLCFLLIFVIPLLLFSQIHQTDTLYVLPGDSLIELKNRWILPSSIEFDYPGNKKLEIDSMRIDALHGRIRGFLSPSDTVKVIILYQSLNLNIPTQTIVNTPPRLYNPIKSESSRKVVESHTKIRTSSNYDFLRSGTLYRGITLGSESGLSLQSGLNLELHGKLSKDVSIVGALSDQNVPIQPEGNTQTLDEIDKVFIRIQMPNEQIILGDYELSLQAGRLGTYNRKLQGVYASSDRSISKTTAAGAITKGQYHSIFFMGEEGNQGPYKLYGKEGERAIIVLAGTEKVWVNGTLLLRGENKDYVIDYSTGEITFMPRQLVTSNSRITVDFQYSDLFYVKNIWLLRNETSILDDRMQISAGVISETDDRKNPLELSLSSEDKNKLKNVGDNEKVAFQNTIREDTNGVYILADSILYYKGSGKGTHSAYFYNFGKIGEYKKVYSGELTYFEWIDKGNDQIQESEKEQAIYLPARPLKLPSKQRLYHLMGNWKLSDNFSVSSEFAVSDLDLNTFSDFDDSDNRGNSVNMEMSFHLPMDDIGNLSLKGKFYEEANQFNPIDRHQAVEYRRKWDLPSDSSQGVKVYEGIASYNLKNYFNWDFDVGVLSKEDIQSKRYRLGGSLRYKWINYLRYSQEMIYRSGDLQKSRNWSRRNGGLSLRIFSLKPYTGIDFERRKGDMITESNFRFSEEWYGIESDSKEKLKWRLENRYRYNDKFSDEEWKRSSVSQTFIFDCQIINWRTFSSQWNYTQRKKEYYENISLPDVNFQLLSLMLRQNPEKLPFRWETNMKVEEEKIAKKEWRYFPVGKGEGQFIYDSTFVDYVPDLHGDHVLRILPANEQVPVTSIQNGFRFRFDGRSLKNIKRFLWLNQVSTLTDIRLQQQIKKAGSPFKKLSLFPSSIDSQWVYYQRIIQNDLMYCFKIVRGQLRLRILNSDRLSQLDVRGNEESFSEEYSLRYKGQFFYKMRLEAEVSAKHLKRNSRFNVLRNRDIETITGSGSFSYILGKIHYLGVMLNMNRDVQSGDNFTKSVLIGLKSTYEQKLTGKGRWKVFTEIANVAVNPKGKKIPWEMSNGKKEGITIGWGSSVEYKIGKHLSIRVNYEAWNEPYRETYHIGTGEVRALF